MPGGVQGLDRYAYANNNPVRYNDPSGHGPAVTNMLYTDDILPSPPSPSTPSDYYIDAMIAYKYHIKVIGDGSNSAKRNLYGALENLNDIFNGITQLTAGSVYKFAKDSYYHGWTEGGNITFYGGTGGAEIPYQNYYHEIAHAINNKAGGFFTNALEANALYTSNGEYVMGGPAANYQRNSQGYISQQILDPIGSLTSAQQHPGTAPCGSNEWCQTGNTPGEEWGDLVANYVAGNFDISNEFGIIRQNWVYDIWLLFTQTR